MTLEGRVENLSEIIQRDGSDFQKRIVLLRIEPNSDYYQDIPIEVWTKNLAILDPVNVGDTISIDINLRGNEYNGKHYVSINAWRLTVKEAAGGSPANVKEAPSDDDLDLGEDDLPF